MISPEKGSSLTMTSQKFDLAKTNQDLSLILPSLVQLVVSGIVPFTSRSIVGLMCCVPAYRQAVMSCFEDWALFFVTWNQLHELSASSGTTNHDPTPHRSRIGTGTPWLRDRPACWNVSDSRRRKGVPRFCGTAKYELTYESDVRLFIFVHQGNSDASCCRFCRWRSDDRNVWCCMRDGCHFLCGIIVRPRSHEGRLAPDVIK